MRTAAGRSEPVESDGLVGEFLVRLWKKYKAPVAKRKPHSPVTTAKSLGTLQERWRGITGPLVV